MAFTTIIGIIAAICTTISFLPQTIKTIKTKQTKDLSFMMYSIFVFGVFMWLVYGIIINDFPLMLANIITFILAGTVLVLKIKYG